MARITMPKHLIPKMMKRSKRQPLSPLPAAFFKRGAATIARALLGRLLVRRIGDGLLVGRIVETEAYGGFEDKASHAYGGLKNRNAPMFDSPGTIYVYFTYGSCFCFNVVCGRKGHPDAVLVRAVEPTAGIVVMERHRGTRILKNLCSGPGKLCQAFAIGKELNGKSLIGNDSLWIAEGVAVSRDGISASPRVGLGERSAEWRDAHLRFCAKRSPFLSRRES